MISGSIDFVSNNRKAFLNETVINEANYFTFRSSSSRKKFSIYFLRVAPGNYEWNTKQRKTLTDRTLKKYLCLWNILC